MKTSEILTNQKAELYVERIFSHSICSEQIFKLVKPAEVSFPDYPEPDLQLAVISYVENKVQ